MDDKAKAPIPWKEIRGRFHPWLRPFLWVEWLTEWFVYWLGRWALIDLAKLVAGLSVVWAAINYSLSGDERRQAQEDQTKAKHYQAWQVINSAQGKGGSGGRIDALQDLVADGVSLEGIDLDSAWLAGVKLRDAKANYGSVSWANLSRSDLTRASLIRSNLSTTNLSSSCLVAANIRDTTLEYASFRGADLRGVLIVNTNLDAADLYRANLQQAILHGATFLPHGRTGDVDPPSAVLTNLRYYRNRSVLLNRSFLTENPSEPQTFATMSEYWSFEDDRERMLADWNEEEFALKVEPSDLTGADLRGITIQYSQLRHAVLDSVDLEGAVIENSDLRGVRLRGAKNWRKIKSFNRTVFHGSEDVPDGFLRYARSKGGVVAISPDSATSSGLAVYTLLLTNAMLSEERPDSNPTADSLARTACKASRSEFPLGGRFAALNFSRNESEPEVPSDLSHSNATPIHVWDASTSTFDIDSTAGRARIVNAFIVENTSDRAVTAELTANAGVYDKCIYDESSPMRTFRSTQESVARVTIAPHSRRTVQFSFSDIPNRPPSICAGVPPMRPSVAVISER